MLPDMVPKKKKKEVTFQYTVTDLQATPCYLIVDQIFSQRGIWHENLIKSRVYVLPNFRCILPVSCKIWACNFSQRYNLYPRYRYSNFRHIRRVGLRTPNYSSNLTKINNIVPSVRAFDSIARLLAVEIRWWKRTKEGNKISAIHRSIVMTF